LLAKRLVLLLEACSDVKLRVHAEHGWGWATQGQALDDLDAASKVVAAADEQLPSQLSLSSNSAVL